MEDVLDLYHEEYDRECPVVCFDESSRQLLGEERPLTGVGMGGNRVAIQLGKALKTPASYWCRNQKPESPHAPSQRMLSDAKSD